jgi:hypothetical protein
MHGHEKSDPAIVAGKLTNKQSDPLPSGAKGRDQGECGPAKHALDSEPVKRVTGVGWPGHDRGRFHSKPGMAGSPWFRDVSHHGRRGRDCNGAAVDGHARDKAWRVSRLTLRR